jgi:hypothetical protein
MSTDSERPADSERPLSRELPPPPGVEAPDLVVPDPGEPADDDDDFEPGAGLPEPPD